MPIQTAEQAQNVFGAPVTGPSQSGTPPGETGGPGTTGANEVQWKSQPQSAEQYYAPGGQGTTNQNISNPAYPNYVGPPITSGDGYQNQIDINTGSESSGAKNMFSGKTSYLVDLFNEITGGNVLEGGIGNLRELSRDTLSLSDQNMMKNLMNQDTQNPYITGNPLKTSTIQPNDYTIMKPTINAPTTEPNIKEKDRTQLLGGEGTTGWQYNVTDPANVGYQFNENLGVEAGFDPLNQQFGVSGKFTFGEGGPVGVMSLPQGYANGGEVIEGTDTMEELTPFGGTRERVIDQVEAFDNAPHHIEEPMIGMWGEKIPLTTARRVQEYMQGLDPVKKGLIEEMMQMFHMKNMMEKQQDQERSGQYFGPQPKEYAI